jgi:5-methylcytosine-specific restriction endonuclease McrA
VAACSSCNHRKGGRSLDDSNMKLRHMPTEPPRSAYYIFGRHLKDYIEWEPYLVGW